MKRGALINQLSLSVSRSACRLAINIRVVTFNFTALTETLFVHLLVCPNTNVIESVFAGLISKISLLMLDQLFGNSFLSS